MSKSHKAIAANRSLVNDMLSIDHLYDRLASASGEEWAEGLAWYDTAYGIAESLGHEHNLPTDIAAGIIAATSPQNAWDINVRHARDLCANPNSLKDFGLGLGSNRAKYLFHHPHLDPLTVLGGPKVRSFYRNIAEPWTPGPVTIDRHAIAILANRVTARWLEDHPKFLERSTIYRQCTAFYRTAARAYNILPHQAQAVAWVSHRNANFIEGF
jgi:hypothetical protein